MHCAVIRPAIPQPPKKTDPVKRYHEFQKMWENFKPPAECPRNALRWSIRVCDGYINAVE